MREDLLEMSPPIIMPIILPICLVYSICIPGLGFVAGCGLGVFSPFTYTYPASAGLPKEPRTIQIEVGYFTIHDEFDM